MWDAFLRRVKVGGALPVEFLATDLNASGRECCRITMLVPSVVDIPMWWGTIKVGDQIPIYRIVALPDWSTENDAAKWVRDQIRSFYQHEADEQFRLDAGRPFPPLSEHR